MESHTESSIAKGIRDIVVLGAIIGGVNAGVSRADIGWLQMNPTPWLLLPTLVGARYGVTLGVSAGIATALGLAVLLARGEGISLQMISQHHPFYFSALIVAGLIAGEFRRYTKGRSRELIETTHHQAEELYRVKAELELCRETRHALQRHLALHQAATASLDDDLRKVIIGKPAELFDNLLALLQQHTQLVSAAIYKVVGGNLIRQAVLEPTAALAETLRINEVPLAAKALDETALASVKDPLTTSASQPFLAAIPFADTRGAGVLLIQDMPLQSFDWQNLARMDLVLHWTFALLRHREVLGGGGSAVNYVVMEDFMALLGEALQAEATHALPSCVLRVDFNKLDEAQSAQTETRLLASLPATALVTRLPAHGSLIVLLPFGGEMDAEATSRALSATGAALRVSHYLVVGPTDTQAFWAHVMQADNP
jgi:hypothetical protein